MRLLKEHLPWIAPTVAIVLVATGYLDRPERQAAVAPVTVARSEVASPAISQVAAVSEAGSIPDSTAEQLARMVAAATAQGPSPASDADVQVTRTAPLNAPLSAPLAEAASAAAFEQDTAADSDNASGFGGENAAAFFASAQQKLATQNTCADDLRALTQDARVYFPTGGLNADESGMMQARLIGQVARQCPGVTVQVEGHSDPSGDPQANMVLSKQRAEAVIARIASAGIDTSHLLPVGFGDQRPSSVEGSQPAAYYDRRVEFSIVMNADPMPAVAPALPWQTASCVSDLERAVARTRVFYAPGAIMVSSSDLDPVIELASLAANCDQARLRVIGHHSDAIDARETVATARLRALAMMSTLVSQGFPADQIIIGVPSRSMALPGQPNAAKSRVDFDIILEEG